MDEKQLKTGIAMLYDMELNNYLMTKTISRMSYEIEDLGIKRIFSEPRLQQESDNHGLAWIGGFGCLGAFIGMFVGAFANALLSSVVLGILIGLCIGGCGLSISYINSDKAVRERYEQDCNAYNIKVENDNARVKRELQEKEIIINEINQLIERRKTAKEKMIQFYDKMGIDEKYRKLIPIGYMNDFIRLGISTKLEGADGLYYMIRKELRYDQMQCTLEDISKKLDEIVDRESKIYSEICDMNNRCEELVEDTKHLAHLTAQNADKLEQMAHNSEIAAYNSERIARENEYQSFLMTWKY